jgi:hypothetical protein
VIEYDPFGLPDGNVGNFDEIRGDLVAMPGRFGGLARDPNDARVRVIAGALGSGKSLLLRRMRESRLQYDSSVASNVQRNEDLLTPLVREFSRRMDQTTSNTEYWSLLWRRAILRTAWSFVSNQAMYNRPDAPQAKSALERLHKYESLLGSPANLRRASSQVARLIRDIDGKEAFIDYLLDDRWEDVEGFLGTVLAHSPELFIYVDDIDKNYAWSPGPWTQCQRGLFYAVMHLAKDDSPLRNKLHVVVALRDVTLATVAAGEHGPQYAEQTHINYLRWTRESAHEFLHLKLAKLPPSHFSDPQERTVESWIGISSVTNGRPNLLAEGIEGYMIRHTRLVPRDIVIMGNMICALQRESGRQRLAEDEIRDLVSDAARASIRSQLNVCASMMLEDTPHSLVADYDSDATEAKLDQQLGDKVTAIVGIIEQVGQEVFTPKKCALMDVRAQEIFRTQARLSNALWRNRLIGWVEVNGKVHFFEPRDYHGRSQLPRGSGVHRYVWHCMIHDIARNIEINGDAPYHPN